MTQPLTSSVSESANLQGGYLGWLEAIWPVSHLTEISGHVRLDGQMGKLWANIGLLVGPSRSGKPVRSGQTVRSDGQIRSEGQGRPVRSGQTVRSDRSGQVRRSGQTGQVRSDGQARSDRSGQVSRSGQTGQVRSGQVRPVRSDGLGLFRATVSGNAVSVAVERPSPPRKGLPSAMKPHALPCRTQTSETGTPTGMQGAEYVPKRPPFRCHPKLAKIHGEYPMDFAVFVRWIPETSFWCPWKGHPALERDCRVRRNGTPSHPAPRPAKRTRRLARKERGTRPSDALSAATQNSQKSMGSTSWILPVSCDGFR